MKETLYIAINYKNGTTEAVAMFRNGEIEDLITTNSLVEYKKWLEEQKSLGYNIKFITLGKVEIMAETLNVELDEKQIESLKSIEYLISKYFELKEKLDAYRVKFVKGRSPINRYGGKANMAEDIIPYFPPQFENYVEPFGGAGHILFKKSHSKLEVYNDLDYGLYNLFSVIKDENMCSELIDSLMLTLYSVYEFDRIKFCLKNNIGLEDKVEHARKTYVNILQSMNNLGECISRSYLGIRNNMCQNVSAYRGHEADLPKCHDRLQGVVIENNSYEVVVKKYDSPQTFFYNDPPYTHSERVSKNAYKFEMSDKMHIEFCEVMSNIQGYVMISGYDNNIYDEYLKGFKKIKLGTYKARSSSKKVKGNREEFIWVNYDVDTGRKIRNNIILKELKES